MTTRKSPRAGAHATTSRLGRRLREARERAGLSVRQLAAATRLSPSTILDAEAGGDPRRSTLLSYLAALPALSPGALLADDAEAVPRRWTAAWTTLRDALGHCARRMRYEVVVGSDGTRVTRVAAEVEAAADVDGSREPGRSALAHAIFRGSPEARARLSAALDDPSCERISVEDGCFVHAIQLPARRGAALTYERTQRHGPPPPGFGPPGSLALAAPFRDGLSFAIEHPIERLELVARFTGRAAPSGARCSAWAVQQALESDERDFAPLLHAEGLRVLRRPSDGLTCVVTRPVLGLHYGIGWDPPADAPAADRARGAAAPSPLSAVLADSRGRAGLSQRELARRIGVSPVTIASAERGQDVRASILASCLAALPGLDPRDLLPAEDRAGRLSRRELWELQRLLFGVEAEEERKTLHVSAEGDAHAVCQTLGLRRVRPSEVDLRVRYSSALATGKRLPTVLRAIEDAVATDRSGLKARVVERREGRLIHEIRVPRRMATAGVSFSRRLFDAGFFDARAEAGALLHDGAALVPFYPVRRLRLEVRLPPGRFPESAVFGVHPRMMIDGPLPEADVTAALHPEGLETRLSPRSNTLTLIADYPLVGFMYDVFWPR